MSGNRYLLDTNAIGDLLRHEFNTNDLIENADWIGCSVINIIEYRSIDLGTSDLALFEHLISRIQVIDVNHTERPFIIHIADLRKKYRLKTPDAIIAATAIVSGASLVTRDKHFSNIKNLKVIIPQ